MTSTTLETTPPDLNRKLALIPILFNIHVEPDLRLINFEKQRWLGYEDLHSFLMMARPTIEQATGRPVHFNWLLRLDQQIQAVYGKANWVFYQYASLIDEARKLGDAFGVHVHSWRPKQQGQNKTWVADFADKDWIASCIAISHKSFVDSLGEQPQFFSFGDHFMNQDTLKQLESLGFRGDLSMYPGRQLMQRHVKDEETCGWLPGFLNTPRHAFKPSRAQYSRPGQDVMNLWEIPVSVGYLKNPLNPHVTDVEKLLIGISFHQAKEIIEQNLALPNPYLLAETRSDVRLDYYNREQFDQTLEYLVNHPLISTMEFCTVPHYLDQLDYHLMGAK